jgi:DNA-binding NarL/FixJ family response regulator
VTSEVKWDVPELDESAARLYLALAGQTGVRPDPQAWAKLRKLRLVEGSVDRPVLRDPAPVLRRVQRDLRRRTMQLEEHTDRLWHEMERLGEAYQHRIGAPESGNGKEAGDLEDLDGIDNINAAIDEACRSAQREVLCAQPGGGRSAEVLNSALERDLALLDRAVTLRTLYQHPARFSTSTRYYVEQVAARGAEVRTLDEFCERLIIVDQTVAFLPARADRQAAVAVRQPAVVSFLADVFERAWIRAVPFSNDMGRATLRESVDSTRRAIARLVVQGDTDDVSARRAGLSLRNYREHVRQLMAQLGTRSRSELGYRIGRLNLLEDDAEGTSPGLDARETPDAQDTAS